MDTYDVAIVGSGFGGSVAALRLTEKGYRVVVLESGRRFAPEDFPESSWNVRRFLWFPRLGMRGIQRLTLLKDVLILSGAGVGGGSLVYANTLYEPLDEFWADPHWSGITNWKEELAPHYARARMMLGATETPFETESDVVMRRVAERMGAADTFHPTTVGVYFGEPGQPAADPFFGGAGPVRTGCTRCGRCIVGCKVGAKNTLDQNYLYLAEKNGATILPEHEVRDVIPIASGGYDVVAGRPGAWLRRRRRTVHVDQVVFSAGVIGTLKLLFRLKSSGRLPGLSERLGDLVRTNSEALVGATARTTDIDYSKGIAITSSIHPEKQTHIEPVRYPKGSNLMGLLGTILVDGGGRVPRQLKFLGRVISHPIAFLRSLSVYRWSERTIILLVMQSLNNSLKVRAKKGPLGLRLTSSQGEGDPNPTYIPAANEAARLTADEIGGYPTSSINEVILNVPTTAHILGGACVGEAPEAGVIDPYHRLFGHPDMHVADGSVVTANLGVNPSLTITALAERAFSLWPNKGEPDLRPAPGAAYAPMLATPPRSPAVPSDLVARPA